MGNNIAVIFAVKREKKISSMRSGKPNSDPKKALILILETND